MGIKIGGIDIAESTINNELRIGVLEKIVTHLLNRMGPTAGLTQDDINRFKKETATELQGKYPGAGLELKNS